MVEDEEDQAAEVEPARWSWITFLSWAISAVSGWCTFCGLTLEALCNWLDAHVMWKTQQAEFQRRATLELEALIATPAPAKVPA